MEINIYYPDKECYNVTDTSAEVQLQHLLDLIITLAKRICRNNER